MSRKGRYPVLAISVFEEYIDGKQALLPQLKSVERLSPAVMRVLGCNPSKMTMQGTNTYIVGTRSKRLLIDTGAGCSEWAELVSSTLAESSISISRVLLTHWHGVHVGGVPDLIARHPELVDSIHKHMPEAQQHQRPITDGQVFRVEGATVRALYTPGHTNDHMCFVLEEEGAMFTGDQILGHGTAVYENLGLWMASMGTIGGQGCTTGYPGHGDKIHDLPTKARAEIGTKNRRARHVLQKLKNVQPGSRLTVSQLVTEMHGAELNPEMQENALVPFLDETLRKLAEDGKVGFDNRGGQRRWFALA